MNNLLYFLQNTRINLELNDLLTVFNIQKPHKLRKKTIKNANKMEIVKFK